MGVRIHHLGEFGLFFMVQVLASQDHAISAVLVFVAVREEMAVLNAINLKP